MKLYFEHEILATDEDWQIPMAHTDTKIREYADTLFFRDPRVKEVFDKDEADFIIRSSRSIRDETRLNHDKYIILNLGDVRAFYGGIHEDNKRNEINFREHVYTEKKTLIYIQVEWNMPYTQRLIKPNNRIFFISIPLLLGGSAFNIHAPDKDGDLLFVKHLKKNPKEYKYEWGYVGHRSSEDRKNVEKELYKLKDKFRLLTNLTNNKQKPILPYDINLRGKDSYLISTRHIRARHKDNRTMATIPIYELMEIIKKTKINISCNGHGVWCLRDGEIFSRNSFNLRQHHKELTRNPLTPKDGKHWVIFNTGNLIPKIRYYLKNKVERERINDAGHEYFKWGITGGWAGKYVDMFEEYLKTNNKKVFEGFLL